LVRYRLHSPWSRRVYASAPPAPVKVGQLWPPRRGRLDGRLIRRATLTGLRLRAGPSLSRPARRSLTRTRLRRVPSHSCSSPPLCRRERRRGGYRDACSIARSLRGLLDACSIPRRGQPDRPDRARDRPALPADPALPVEHGALIGAARRPVRRPAGCEVEASCYVMRPSHHAGAAASFAVAQQCK
jgi:hypothetical protein